MRSGRGGRLDADGVSGVLEGFGAEARISTGDVPPRQYLGSVRFEVETSGSVRVPLVLLDPERPWADRDATLDVADEGTATCGSDTIEYRSGDTTTGTVDTSIGQFEATGWRVDWSVGGSAVDSRTTIWSAAGLGPVRIDVDTRGTTRTYDLDALDRPTTDSTTQPTGE
jgi:hypothetical protein